MTIELENHLWAFLGSISLIFSMILVFKARKDRGYKKTWKWFWNDQWDDFAGIMFFGQICTLFMEQAFAFYVNMFGSSEDWDWFIDSQELFAFMVGALGMSIFWAAYRYGKSKLGKFFKEK